LSKKITTEEFINKSKLRFGDLLDYSNSNYINAKTKVEFRCKKHNHIFYQVSNNHLYSKFPCEFCKNEYKRKLFADTLDTFKDRVQKKYGDLFSFDLAKYKNQNTEIVLICKIHNTKIINTPYQILKGHGCKLCAKEKEEKERSQNTLKKIHKYVDKLNGKCVSKTYKNNESNLEFECENGHRFFESWSDVKNSLRWCPKCSPNKLIGETIARLMLEHLLKLELPSVYIEELDGLQLDGYNSKNKIAFEYQGYQHYTKESHFNRSKTRYQSQIERDNRKKLLCKENRITLIEIFEFDTIRASRILIFYKKIKETLNTLGIKYNTDPFILNLVELYRGKKSGLYYRAKQIVEYQNGMIQEYIGSESKHYYICSNGHKVKNRVLSVIIKSNASCPYCEQQSKFIELKKVLETRGGTLIDIKLKAKGYSELYSWVCENGHKNESKGQYLINGFWCAHCQREKLTIRFSDEKILQFSIDVESGKFYQKDLPKKYGISDTAYRRMISEYNLTPNYIPQDRKAQKKRTKGRLFQLDPDTLNVIYIFESLEAVKNSKHGIFTPGGIRNQMKNFKKAYGFYWCRENNFQKTIEVIKNDHASPNGVSF